MVVCGGCDNRVSLACWWVGLLVLLLVVGGSFSCVVVVGAVLVYRAVGLGRVGLGLGRVGLFVWGWGLCLSTEVWAVSVGGLVRST